jgi:hypothetical protein
MVYTVIGFLIGFWVEYLLALVLRHRHKIGSLMIIDQESGKPAMLMEIDESIGTKPGWIDEVRKQDYIVLDINDQARK